MEYHNTTSYKKGISWMLVHAFAFAIIQTTVKGLELSVAQNLLFQYWGLVIINLPWALRNLSTFFYSQWKLHFLQAMLGGISMLLYFIAVKYISITLATAISLFAPVAASIVAITILNEQLSIMKFICLSLGLVGTIIILMPANQPFHWMALPALTATIIWGFMWPISRVISKKEPPRNQLVLQCFIRGTIILPFALYYWQPISIEGWSWAIILGLLLCFEMGGVIASLAFAPVAVVMPFMYSGIVFAAIIDVFIFQTIPEIHVLFGSIIVMTSNILMIRHEKS